MDTTTIRDMDDAVARAKDAHAAAELLSRMFSSAGWPHLLALDVVEPLLRRRLEERHDDLVQVDDAVLYLIASDPSAPSDPVLLAWMAIWLRRGLIEEARRLDREALDQVPTPHHRAVTDSCSVGLLWAVGKKWGRTGLLKLLRDVEQERKGLGLSYCVAADGCAFPLTYPPSTATGAAKALIEEEAPTRLKRAALVAKYERQWPTIDRDLRDAATNGLSQAAKAEGHGYWFEEPSLFWARARGKISSGSPVASVFHQI